MGKSSATGREGLAVWPAVRGVGALPRVSNAVTAVLPAVVLAAMGYHRRWVADDAFITLRVVQHLLAGHGPVYNLGERVEAYTHPLWMAVLAAWGTLGRSLEVGAVVLGLLFSVGGLLAAQAGATRLARHVQEAGASRQPGVALPLGAMVVAVVPATWDFTTSGLETGLAFGWLGVAFWLLARLCTGEAPLPRLDEATGSPRRRWVAAAFVLGLGPLVRPDLAVFSAAFLLALLVCYVVGPSRRYGELGWGWLPLVLAAGFVPGVYQVFRMGYFAALVPNTALAKEAAASYWSQGWRYAEDFVGTYMLWLPLLPLLGWWTVLLWRVRGRSERAATAVLLAPVLAAIVHVGWVIRVGGDFMHGRFLLPSLFGALLPVTVVILPAPTTRARRSFLMWGVIVLVLAWAVTCAFRFRVPYVGSIGPAGIADERGYYVRNAGRANPVAIADYAAFDWAQVGLALRARAEQQRSHHENARVLLVRFGRFPDSPVQEFPLAPMVPADVDLVVTLHYIGIPGYTAGPSVHVVDRHGVSDPLTARAQLAARGRPGHEKELPEAWSIARFADPWIGTTPAILAARESIGCGDLGMLRRAVEEPLTINRFLQNLRLSWKLHRLRIPADPMQAWSVFCQ